MPTDDKIFKSPAGAKLSLISKYTRGKAYKGPNSVTKDGLKKLHIQFKCESPKDESKKALWYSVVDAMVAKGTDFNIQPDGTLGEPIKLKF
mgnify:CR=1 FL=1